MKIMINKCATQLMGHYPQHAAVFEERTVAVDVTYLGVDWR